MKEKYYQPQAECFLACEQSQLLFEYQQLSKLDLWGFQSKPAVTEKWLCYVSIILF